MFRATFLLNKPAECRKREQLHKFFVSYCFAVLALSILDLSDVVHLRNLNLTVTFKKLPVALLKVIIPLARRGQCIDRSPGTETFIIISHLVPFMVM